MMANITIVNTHTKENPYFVNRLRQFLDDLAIESIVIDAREKPSGEQRVILTGVPLDATYSLSKRETQAIVEDVFDWLRTYPKPVLGICYGHQILAHIFGGHVAPLGKKVKDEHYPLSLETDQPGGIFSDIAQIEVFAEHRDYVAKIPPGFNVLSRKHGVPYIIYHPAREFYGLQFVPERSDQETRQILKEFVTG
jgi:GMP synthase (glutamine-hydrolysing)